MDSEPHVKSDAKRRWLSYEGAIHDSHFDERSVLWAVVDSAIVAGKISWRREPNHAPILVQPSYRGASAEPTPTTCRLIQLTNDARRVWCAYDAGYDERTELRPQFLGSSAV